MPSCLTSCCEDKMKRRMWDTQNTTPWQETSWEVADSQLRVLLDDYSHLFFLCMHVMAVYHVEVGLSTGYIMLQCHASHLSKSFKSPSFPGYFCGVEFTSNMWMLASVLRITPGQDGKTHWHLRSRSLAQMWESGGIFFIMKSWMSYNSSWHITVLFLKSNLQ